MEPTSLAGVDQVDAENSTYAREGNCPVCGGYLFEIRATLQCTRCGTICEGCCEGGFNGLRG